MSRQFGFTKATALSAAVLAIAAFAAAPSAKAQSVRHAGGQAYWSGNPGPVDPGAFWDSGEYKYDPNHYLSDWSRDQADYSDVVYAPHRGPARCVWRKRVVNSEWEFQHPYLRVCRW